MPLRVICGQKELSVMKQNSSRIKKRLSDLWCDVLRCGERSRTKRSRSKPNQAKQDTIKAFVPICVICGQKRVEQSETKDLSGKKH